MRWHELGPDPDAGVVAPPRDVDSERGRVLSAHQAYDEHIRSCRICTGQADMGDYNFCFESRRLADAVLAVESDDDGGPPNLRRICTRNIGNEPEAIAAAGALDIARDAHLEGRFREEQLALAETPNVIVPEIGLKLHDVYEWERIFEDADRRDTERAALRARLSGVEETK